MPRNPPQPPSPPPPEAPSTSEPVPAELEALAAEAEGLDAPAPTPDKAVEPEVPTADLLAGVLGPAFQIIAPNWRVTDTEVKMLAGAYGTLVDKWWPGGASQWGPELTALLATVAVFGPRLNTPRVKPPAPKTDVAPEPPRAV